jgi:alpha-beta hydrolase superfamily lysophospholipase
MNLEIISKYPDAETRPAPLLFVHGAWHGAWCWDEHFLSYFASKGYHAHALSLRGHGSSEGRNGLRWNRIGDYVADVADVAETMDTPPVVIGHSMGGLVVQKYLESHRAPAGVLLASVPPAGALRTALSIARRHPWAFLKANLGLSLYPVIGTPKLAREAFFTEKTPSETLDKYFACLQDESYLAFLDMLFFNLPKPEKVETNLLVLGAEKDTIFTPYEIEATARAYRAAPEIWAGMAHDMMLDKNWRSVADRIIEWLDYRGL